jgi:zinc protease
VIGTSVRTDATAAAVTEILQEVDRMCAEDVSEPELETAKDSITRSLPGLFETTAEAVSSSGHLYVHELPLDYYRALPARVQAVTAGEVKRVARDHLKGCDMVVVAVGDKTRIEADLAQLNLGPIRQADADGNPL